MTPELFIQNNTWLLFAITVWSLPWKGVALWRAAKRGDTRWFIAMLILNTAALLEMVYLFYISKRSSDAEVENVLKEETTRHEDSSDPIDQWLNRKADIKDEIIAMLGQKEKLTLIEIEKAFEMPATAVSNFIEELLNEDRIIELNHEEGRSFVLSVEKAEPNIS